MKNAYVTVLTNDSYLKGCVVLAKSLVCTKTVYPLVVICHKDVTESSKQKLLNLGCQVLVMDEIRIDGEILKDNTGWAEKWNTTFFKLNAARVQFDKIVLLDSDMLVVKNIDHLFLKPHMSCVPAGKFCGGGKKYGLNSGLLVMEPGEELFKKLVDAIKPMKSKLKGKPVGDQDVFKFVYDNWENQPQLELSETYNCYAKDIDELIRKKAFSFEDIFVIHYANMKPWEYSICSIPICIIRNQFHNYKNFRCFYQLKAYFLWWTYFAHS